MKPFLGRRVDPEEDLINRWGEPNGKLLSFISGNMYASQGCWADALAEWKKSEHLIGGFSLAGIDVQDLSKGIKKEECKHLSLGAMLFFERLHDSSLSEFNKALAVNPGSFMSNYWAAQVHMQKGDNAQAIKCFEKGLESAPGHFSSLYSLGDLHYLAQQTATSLSYYKKALLIKEDAGILIKLGLIHEKDKRFDEAEGMYQKVIQLEPDLFVGYNQLAWLYARRGASLDKAWKLAKEADSLMPGNASILDTMGWIQFQKKAYRDALATLKRAEQVQPGNPTILFHLANAYEATGSKNEARACLERALRHSRNHDWEKDAKALSERLK